MHATVVASNMGKLQRYTQFHPLLLSLECSKDIFQVQS